MKTTPILPATIDFAHESGVPFAPRYGDVYHPASGAFAQAHHVFLGGNGLPERWRGRDRFAILETGFGLGNSFLATWQAWREDPSSPRLTYVSLEQHPPTREDLRRAHAACPVPLLAQQLHDGWPPHMPGLHVLDLEGGRLRLVLGWGEATALARQLVGRFDALYLDGFAPSHNPQLWTPDLFKALARLSMPGTTAATWSAARAVRDGLSAQGFAVTSAPGQGGKREMTLARFAPRFVPPRPPGRAMPTAVPSHALVIGGGLAGSATASALARRGIEVRVLDRHAAPASEASGNPAALFHGSVAPDDGPHARCLRAAALQAQPWLREAVAAGVPGAIDGAAQLSVGADVDALQAIARVQGLDAAYAQPLEASAVAARAGVPTAQAAWWYPGGGWIAPEALVRHWLAAPGVRWHGEHAAASIEPSAEGWRVLDAQGRLLGEAPLLVLANAHDALRLAGLPLSWLQPRRGQVSLFDASQLAHAPPQRPLAGHGYAIGLPDGGLLLGATSTIDDADEALRAADHVENLARAETLCGIALVKPGAVARGRVGWRATSVDRLPLTGFAPDPAAPPLARRDAPRLVGRRPGLSLHAGLGSRGVTTCVLGAELIAAQACGEPWPLEADLVDAIDPARRLLRGAQS